MAESAEQALKKERKERADDCWIDEDWKKENMAKEKSITGFSNPKKNV